MKKLRKRLLWGIGITAAVLLGGYLMVDASARPMIMALSDAKARVIAVVAINDAIREVMVSNPAYQDLVEVQHDQDGKITMIQTRSVTLNQLAAEAALTAQDKIAKIGFQGFDIPIGSLIGGQMLAGRGPSIHVNVLPVGSVITEYETVFEAAGINQTRYKILLQMHVQVRIVAPNASQKVEVVSQVPISEVVLVGDVPQYYLSVDDQDKMLNLMPGTP